MNKIELILETQGEFKHIGFFNNLNEIQDWIEKFYHVSYEEMKKQYEDIRDNSDTFKKYPHMFKDYTLEYWIAQYKSVHIKYVDYFTKSKRYDNGELITKPRMEDEEWYYNLYQPFLEFAIGGYLPDVDATYNHVISEFKNLFDEELSDREKERILRWSVLHCERTNSIRKFELDEKSQ